MNSYYKALGLLTLSVLAACSARNASQNSTDSESTEAEQGILSAPLLVDASEAGSTNSKMSKMDVNIYPLNKLVCDPMGSGDPQPQSNAGIEAELYWINPLTQPHYSKVADYINYGLKSDKKLFYSQINVPRRSFSLGFPLESGGSVMDDSGGALIEWFALRFKTVFKLAPDQEEGLYEIAVLSDDGAILRMRDDSGNYSELVNNDNVHATRLGCSSSYIDMKRNTEKLWQLDYFQGPRYSIAAIVLMRKVQFNSQGQPIVDSTCGVVGSNTWFSQDSVPSSNYLSLLNRGWRPLSPKNYSVPVHALFNPCMAGTKPTIFNFHVVERSDTSIWLEWATDIPSTSQLLYRVANSNGVQLTTADNRLETTKHTVILNDLAPGQRYEIQAVSISETYGKSISEPMIVDLTF